MVDCQDEVGAPHDEHSTPLESKHAADASPSIGAYRLSLSLVNLDTANTSFQCPSSHPGRCGGWHLQCFWVRVNPMPVLDQSLARQVGRLVSKDFTQSCTGLTILFLEAAKISSKDVHLGHCGMIMLAGFSIPINRGIFWTSFRVWGKFS